MIRFRPERGVNKVEDLLTAPCLQFSGKLPAARGQSYARYFPSLILIPTLISKNMFLENRPLICSWPIYCLFFSVFFVNSFSLFMLCSTSCCPAVFLHAHMLLELNRWGKKGRMKPPPERASASLLPLTHHRFISDLKLLDT